MFVQVMFSLPATDDHLALCVFQRNGTQDFAILFTYTEEEWMPMAEEFR
jgi:hypothetical protein